MNLLIIFFFLFHSQKFLFADDQSWKIYDDSQVATVEITVNPNFLNWLYQNIYSDSMSYASVHFTNAYIDTTIDSTGFGLRGNTSLDADKKSFQLSFNEFVPGKKFYSVEKLNLNGEHNDPSIIRSKLCWDLFNSIGMKSSRASHCAVYVNGVYYGLYISVEHVDDEFLQKNFDDKSGNLWKCLWPADLVYLGNDPNLYKFENNGRRAYDLKTNENADDYSQLARLIKVVNNTSATLLEDSLEKILEVPEVLKYFAINVLVGGWDSYWFLKNNYYLYHEPQTQKFHLIPYDYDNTFGIDWFGTNWANVNPYTFATTEPRPLATKLLANAKFRNLYTHFLLFYKSTLYLPPWETNLNNLKTLITPFAATDTFRTLDYGFTMSDFSNSYSSASYSNQHVKKGLKQFINERNSTLNGQTNFQNAKPIVYAIDFSPENPLPTDSITVVVSAFSNVNLNEVKIKFYNQNSTTSTDFPMVFSPVLQTKKVEEADRWIGKIAPLGNNGFGAFQIFASDVNSQNETYPKTKKIDLQTPFADTTKVVINEFLAQNNTINTDEAGEFDDWIELYNPTSADFVLSGKFLTDDATNLTKWQFPGVTILAGERLLVWCDNDLTQGILHTNFKLSAGGETILFVENNGVTILDEIVFGNQTADVSFGRSPDASNNWQFLQPTPNGLNLPLEILENNEQFPIKFSLSQNFPNPFNPTTTINYEIKNLEKAKLIIFNVLGEEVKNFELENQKGSVVWNGTDSNGNLVGSGVYFYRLESGNFNQTKRMLFVK
ncbi:CotH kinase family protein [bacterium]|nr:CotH kinase family protein [bacterium]